MLGCIIPKDHELLNATLPSAPQQVVECLYSYDSSGLYGLYEQRAVIFLRERPRTSPTYLIMPTTRRAVYRRALGRLVAVAAAGMASSSGGVDYLGARMPSVGMKSLDHGPLGLAIMPSPHLSHGVRAYSLTVPASAGRIAGVLTGGGGGLKLCVNRNGNGDVAFDVSVDEDNNVTLVPWGLSPALTLRCTGTGKVSGTANISATGIFAGLGMAFEATSSPLESSRIHISTKFATDQSGSGSGSWSESATLLPSRFSFSVEFGSVLGVVVGGYVPAESDERALYLVATLPDKSNQLCVSKLNSQGTWSTSLNETHDLACSWAAPGVCNGYKLALEEVGVTNVRMYECEESETCGDCGGDDQYSVTIYSRPFPNRRAKPINTLIGIILCEVSAFVYAIGICIQRFSLSMAPAKSEKRVSVRATAGSIGSVEVTAPEGSMAGEIVNVEVDGTVRPVEVPSGIKGGERFSVPFSSDTAGLRDCKARCTAFCQRNRANLIWMLGFSLWGAGNGIYFLALHYAALSLLTSLFATVIIFNGILAWKFLGENIRKQDVFGWALICVGTSLTSVFLDTPPRDYTAEELFQLATLHSSAIAYEVGLFTLIVGLWGFVLYNEALERRPEGRPPYVVGLMLAFPCLIALFESLCQICLKGLNDMLSKTLDGDSQLGDWRFYFVFLMLGSFTLAIMWWMRKGYTRFEAVMMLPIQMGTLTSSTVLGGLMFYAEYTQMEEKTRAFHLIMVAVGVGFILLGILYPARSKFVAALSPGLGAFDTGKTGQPAQSIGHAGGRASSSSLHDHLAPSGSQL
jgi:drug/metabolite transporter (DMT)-like permease